jgi:uncharacterized protein (DUF488 family)
MWAHLATIRRVKTQPEVLTVGHSTHSAEAFAGLLRGAEIGAIADVRRYPGSRRNPQFGAEALRNSLAGVGIRYEPLGESLGGRRRPTGEWANAAWRVDQFRGYADHMESAEFEAGLRRLRKLAAEARTAVMCAEADWRRCHRRLLADALLARGHAVTHLLSDGSLTSHSLTEFAALEGERVSYPAAGATQQSLELG